MKYIRMIPITKDKTAELYELFKQAKKSPGPFIIRCTNGHKSRVNHLTMKEAKVVSDRLKEIIYPTFH